jgi:uncharacterized protein YhbP (UPF0306 family)
MNLRSIVAYDITGARVTLNRLTAARTRCAIRRILKKNKLCAIATVGVGGRVHINTAYFAYSDSLDVYFLSHPDSAHCRNVKAHPQAAMAIFDSTQEWGRLDRGLQLFGVCRIAAGDIAGRASRAYAGRFKPYAAWWAGLEADDIAREFRFFRFVVQRVKLFDEREFSGTVFITARTVQKRRP